MLIFPSFSIAGYWVPMWPQNHWKWIMTLTRLMIPDLLWTLAVFGHELWTMKKRWLLWMQCFTHFYLFFPFPFPSIPSYYLARQPNLNAIRIVRNLYSHLWTSHFLHRNFFRTVNLLTISPLCLFLQFCIHNPIILIASLTVSVTQSHNSFLATHFPSLHLSINPSLAHLLLLFAS